MIHIYLILGNMCARARIEPLSCVDIGLGKESFTHDQFRYQMSFFPTGDLGESWSIHTYIHHI